MNSSHVRRPFPLDRAAASMTFTLPPAVARADVRVPGRAYAITKRLLDIVGATSALLLLSPLLLLLVVAIRLESPGPGLFRARRVGQRLRTFRMFKLRTMRCDATTGPAPACAPDWTLVRRGDYLKPAADPRLTRLGPWLRRSSIDELPNLLNVLRGEMSLVGPRPSGWAPESYGTAVDEVFSIRPGMTGLWQVMGRSELSFAERIALDRTYVRHRSLTLDLWILWRTIPAVLTGRGAY